MRNRLFLALTLALLIAAPATAAAAEGKIGVFNSRAVAAQCTALKEAQKKIESQYAGEKATLEKQGADLKKRAEELQTQSAALGADAREDRRASFLRSKRDFEDKYAAFARKVEKAAMQVQQEFGNNLLKATQNYGSAKGYSILLDAAMGGPIYFDKSVDVTGDIITEINRVYKDPKPAAAR